MIESGEMTTTELEMLIAQCERALVVASPHASVTVQVDVAKLKWLAKAALFWERMYGD